jgi:hypothetical protein
MNSVSLVCTAGWACKSTSQPSIWAHREAAGPARRPTSNIVDLPMSVRKWLLPWFPLRPGNCWAKLWTSCSNTPGAKSAQPAGFATWKSQRIDERFVRDHGRRVGPACLTRCGGQHMGESYTTNAATGSGGRSAAKPWMVKRCGTNGPADEE